jgi:hypothetical protein
MHQQTCNKTHELRHVVIRKGNCFGNLILHIDSVRCATAGFLPTLKTQQVLRSYETREEARAAFADMIQIAKNHGWHPIHDGRPNFG